MLSRVRPRGLGLIEVLVAMALMAIATALAIPSFVDWMRNARVRASAESLQSGLQYARAEAARRNAHVLFQLTSSVGSGCALSSSGPAWVVRRARDDALQAAALGGNCNASISDTDSPYLLRRSPAPGSKASTAWAASDTQLAFDGLGRQAALADQGVAAALFWVNVKDSAGSCLTDGGAVQCLRVVVTTAGQVSLCDPSHTSSTDPLYCPEATNG